MSQFTLYENKDKSSNKAYPYFVDVQNHLMNELNSRLVIPLTPTTLCILIDHLKRSVITAYTIIVVNTSQLYAQSF